METRDDAHAAACIIVPTGESLGEVLVLNEGDPTGPPSAALRFRGGGSMVILQSEAAAAALEEAAQRARFLLRNAGARHARNGG